MKASGMVVRPRAHSVASSGPRSWQRNAQLKSRCPEMTAVWLQRGLWHGSLGLLPGTLNRIEGCRLAAGLVAAQSLPACCQTVAAYSPPCLCRRVAALLLSVGGLNHSPSPTVWRLPRRTPSRKLRSSSPCSRSCCSSVRRTGKQELSTLLADTVQLGNMNAHCWRIYAVV